MNKICSERGIPLVRSESPSVKNFLCFGTNDKCSRIALAAAFLSRIYDEYEVLYKQVRPAYRGARVARLSGFGPVCVCVCVWGGGGGGGGGLTIVQLCTLTLLCTSVLLCGPV